jgi:carnitine O-acetyltransferase
MLARPLRTVMSRPLNWKASAPALPPRQPSLPKLPIPDLPATLTRLKDALNPLAVSNAEYAVAVSKIDEFGRGAGNVLHNRLLERDAEREHWLEEWWDDIAYLGYRDSVCTSHTPCHSCSLDTGRRQCLLLLYALFPLPTRLIPNPSPDGFDRQPAHLPQTPAARAAALARAAMIFRQKLKRGQITPDGTKEGPLCMDTYRCVTFPSPSHLEMNDLQMDV